MFNVAAEIDRQLASVGLLQSADRFTSAKIRNLAVEYLAFQDDEQRNFPELAGRPHWNLWLADTQIENAQFAVLLFRSDGVVFLTGTGNAFDIKRFAESDFPGDIAQLPAELARLFPDSTSSLQLSREAAEGWLGRSW